MATYIQRGQSIGNALVNGVATLTQLDRLGRALAWREARLTEYDAGDNNIKAMIYVQAFRSFCLQVLREFEGRAAALAAQDAASDQVDTDFPEAP